MSVKVTPWFPGSVNPEHVGVYQRQYPREIYYCHWDGKCWSCSSTRAVKAEDNAGIFAIAQNLMWRGLAEKP